MPSSPQPRKKQSKGPQDGSAPSCGHTSSRKDCPACKEAEKKPSTSAIVIDLPTDKRHIELLKDKVAEKLRSDPKGANKAAFVISSWINKKR